MRQRLSEYAPYISWLGLFVILAGLLLPLLTRQTGAKVPAGVGPALIVAGIVLALAWPMLRPDEVRETLGGRRARFGGNAVILTVSVVGALVVVNYLSALRYSITDLTSNKQYSISRQTIQILDQLNEQQETIKLTAILPSTDATTAQDLDQLMDRYLARTKKIEYQRIDPQVDNLALLGLAQRLNLGQSIPSRALVAEMDGRNTIVYTGFDEQAVTEALVKVTRTEKKKVVFTTGHGEFDPESSGERSYYSVSQQLEKEGYTVDTINLATITETLSTKTVDVLVVAGATQPFLPDEAQQVAQYVASGGAALVMTDPAVDANLGDVLEPWGLSLQNDVVIQQTTFGMNDSVVVHGDSYEFHTITKDVEALQSVFPAVRSISVGTPVTTSLQVSTLVSIKSGAWGETDFEGLSNGQVTSDPDDIQPPLVLAVAGQPSSSATDTSTTSSAPSYGRIALFGTSRLASDDVLQQLPPGMVANFDFVLNTVDWLALDQELISIRATAPDDRPVTPPSNPLGLLLLTAVVYPLAVLGAGTYVYWRRH